MSNIVISKDKQIKYIFGKGRSSFGTFTGIKFLPSRQKKSIFFIIVSKKVDNKATIRNKIKRQIKEILKSLLEKSNQNYDYVVIVRKNPDSFQQLKDDLTGIFSKARIV